MAASMAPSTGKMSGLKRMDELRWAPESGEDKIVIVSTMWNAEVVAALVDGCKAQLERMGVPASSIVLLEVPGAYELPFAAKKAICKLPSVRAVVCVGVLVKGDTMHFEYISAAVTQGITRVGLDTDVPVIFGVLTCLTEEQARMRAGVGTGDAGPGHNHGVDWAKSAVHMAQLGSMM